MFKFSIIFIILFYFLFISCKQINKSNIKEIKQNSVVSNNFDANMYLYLDSIDLSEKLNEVLNDARNYIEKDYIYKEYYQVLKNGSNVFSKIKIGNLFSTKYRYLIVNRFNVQDELINIYMIENNEFIPILNHEQYCFTYVNDTIEDINGDNLCDFIVNWYGNSGCCLKAFSNVYLYNNVEGNFINNYEFINPTFSPKEKIVRGVCYGQHGDTEMYKFRWNGTLIDTIEYIYYEKIENGVKTGKIISSNCLPYVDCKNRKIKKIKNIPVEYKNIIGFDWFTGEY